MTSLDLELSRGELWTKAERPFDPAMAAGTLDTV